MKLNLKKPIKDLAGNEIPESDLGQLLAQTLASGNSKENAVKMYYWATKLFAGEELDLDPTDTAVLKSFIETNEQLTLLAKGQLLADFK